MESGQVLNRSRFHVIGRVVSLSIIILTVTVIAVTFVRSRRQTRPPGLLRSSSALNADVTSVIENYSTVRSENGRETLRLKAARDVAYADGHHELEEVDLTAYGTPIPGGKPRTTRILARRGRYQPSTGLVNFDGAVTVTSSDGLVVMTESLRYEQQPQLAVTEVAISFRHDGEGGISGRSIGARLSAASRQLELLREVEVTNRRPGDDPALAAPLEIRSQSATYDELQGQIRFTGEARVIQSSIEPGQMGQAGQTGRPGQVERTARANTISGFLDQTTRRLVRIELRGDSRLTSLAENSRRGTGPAASELFAPEIDFELDPEERLRRAVARGGAGADSVDPAGLPRSIRADLLEVNYRIAGTRSLPRQMVSGGRTTVRFESRVDAATATGVTERVVEADGLQALYREDGETFAQITARGNSVLTITPRTVTPGAERRRLRAAQFQLFFAETGNRIRTFRAEEQVQADFEPLQAEARHPVKSLSGRRLNATFNESTQELTETVLDGAVRYSEADRSGTAARATWTAATRRVSLRGRPQLWDSTARTDAEEIDVNLDSNESLLRGKVRTTWFSRETTGGAMPFRNRQAPVTVVADNAVITHPVTPPAASQSGGGPPGGGRARYTGNVRAWQNDEFIRADQLDLDRGEKTLLATGNAQSAYYQLEREVEKGRLQVVPVFAMAERIRYNDGLRRTFYEGTVRIRQGTDLLEAETAEALMDQAHRLLEIVAAGQVVMTQPDRLAKGARVVYDVRDEKARLTGTPATIEDRQQQVLTRSDQLTLYLRDGRFEASSQPDRGGNRRVRTTHRLK